MSFLPLRIIKDNSKINFMGLRKYTFGVTILLSILSIALVFSKGLNMGIDFTGGILIESKFQEAPDLGVLREELISLNIGDVSLQNFGSDKDVMVRIGNQSRSTAEQMKDIEASKAQIIKFYPDVEFRKVDFVGPQVGSELIQDGFIAMILSLGAILAYVWLRFEWQFGLGVVIALIHDTIISIGFLSLSGLEFNLTSIAAVLTVIGYSVNDSVVIFDRIRENMRKYKKMEMFELLNLSINETLSRTILTVLTTILAVVALMLFGGDVIFSFSATVFVGIIVGTYSSIYISAPVLTLFNLKNREVA